MSNLVQVIFEQFLEIVEVSSKKACFVFDECDFKYRVRILIGHQLLDVIYVVQDKCGRHNDVIVTIDITNICLEDLISCKWVAYLEKLAREFIHDICPKKLVVIQDIPKKCRPQPPRWEPFPCKTVTIITKKKPVVVKPECEIIIERECECVPECKRKPCIPKKQIIIRYEDDKKWKCGDHDVLVKEPKHKKHDFEKSRGNKDFNHHLWKKCCEDKKSCCDSHLDFSDFDHDDAVKTHHH